MLFRSECARKSFNKALNEHGWRNCEDSTSSLTTEKRHFAKGNPTKFSMDVCIVCRDTEEIFYRLIHKKTGLTYYDQYYWNEAPHSAEIQKKASLFLYFRRMRGFIPIVLVIIGQPCFFVNKSVKNFFCISTNNANIHRKLGRISFGKMPFFRGQRRC